MAKVGELDFEPQQLEDFKASVLFRDNMLGGLEKSG